MTENFSVMLIEFILFNVDVKIAL